MKTSRMLPMAVFLLLIWNSPLGAQPVITTDLTNLVVLNGSNAVFSVAASGGGSFTYRWLFNGNYIPLITTVAGNGSTGFSGDGYAADGAHSQKCRLNQKHDVSKVRRTRAKLPSARVTS